jgi:hypothetical protein
MRRVVAGMSGIAGVTNDPVGANHEEAAELIDVVHGPSNEMALSGGAQDREYRTRPHHLADRSAPQTVSAVGSARRIGETGEWQPLDVAKFGRGFGHAHRDDRDRDRALLSRLVAQLRGQLAAERSTVVTQESEQHGPLPPQFGELNGSAFRIQNRHVGGGVSRAKHCPLQAGFSRVRCGHNIQNTARSYGDNDCSIWSSSFVRFSMKRRTRLTYSGVVNATASLLSSGGPASGKNVGRKIIIQRRPAYTSP